MMNKYITALLVVLATTGVEAQTYQSALKAAMGNATLEEFCNHLNIKGVETDILSVIEAYKNISKEEENKPAATRLALSDRHKAVHNVRQLENIKLFAESLGQFSNINTCAESFYLISTLQ